MSNSGPSTDKVEFDAIDTHGRPVSLSEEPAGGRVGTIPGEPVAGTSVVIEKKVTTRPDDGDLELSRPDDGDSELRQKLLVAGALVAAGVAIVFGVRHFKGEEQPHNGDTKAWAKRKAKEAKREAKHAAHETKHAGEDAGKKVNEKSGGLLDSAGNAVSSVGNKAKDTADAVADKVDGLRQETKEKVEAEVNEADKRRASPGAELEQRRMTYGQDKHGVPKGLTEDAGFLGYKNWFPGAKKN